MSEVLRFQTNIPQVVALKYPSGLTVKGQYGEQVMYTLMGEERMYLPPIAAQRITSLGIQPGEYFQVGKIEVKQGQKRSVQWQITRIQPTQPANPEPQPPQPQPAAANGHPPNGRTPKTTAAASEPDDLVPKLEESIKQIKQAQQPAPSQGQAAVPAAPPVASPNGRNGQQAQHTTGNGNLPPVKIPYDTALTHFLIVAGRSAREAEKVLGAEGGSVRFDSRDIAAAATTLLIEALHKDMLLVSTDWPGRMKVNGGAK